MHTGEPDLLEVNARTWFPDGRFKVTAQFIDGHGVARHLDDRSHLGVVKLVLAVEQAEKGKRDAQRADGVPYADKGDLVFWPGVLTAESDRLVTLRAIGLAGFLVMVKSLLDEPGIRALENADVVNHTAQGAYRVGAAAETEQEQRIPRGVVLNDVAVIVHDILVDALAGNATTDPVRVGADSPVVKDLLRQLVAADRLDGAGQFQDVGGEVLVRIFLRPVPGSVCANNEAFFHF